MNELAHLQSGLGFSEAEAAEVIVSWAKRHRDMLDNLLRIKSAEPVETADGGFRRQRVSTISLDEIRDILDKLMLNLLAFIEKPQESTPLLQIITHAAQDLKTLYEGHSTSFAVILNELIELQNVLLQQFSTTKPSPEKHAMNVEIVDTAPTTITVYVRVFHRQLSEVGVAHKDLSWLKVLLNSVQESEKHGLAVYAHEDEVRRAMRGENYAYVTVEIQPSQDITTQRRVRQDPQLHCNLLTIAPIKLEQLKKLTYAETDYVIENGMISMQT